MFRLPKKLTGQGITWEQLAFQFVVILLGVYLAIFFERSAEDRGHRREADELMAHVLGELNLDEADFQGIIAGREEKCVGMDSLSLLFRIGSDSNGPQIDSLINGPLAVLQTVFPRRAAYSTMVSGAYLSAITNRALVMRLADLFEHSYPRVVQNGEVIDRWQGETYLIFGDYWDADRRVFISPGANTGAPFRTALFNLRSTYCEWYAGTLLEDVLADLSTVRAEVESYLGR